MAKRQKLGADLFSKTDSKQATASDKIKARGVGLKESEWAEIEKIAGEMGQTAHYVSAALLRHGLEAYRAGKLKPKTNKVQSF